jgi:hypothetical protein
MQPLEQRVVFAFVVVVAPVAVVEAGQLAG